MFNQRRQQTGGYRENRAELFLEVHGRQWARGKFYLGIRKIIPSETSDKREKPMEE